MDRGRKKPSRKNNASRRSSKSAKSTRSKKSKRRVVDIGGGGTVTDAFSSDAMTLGVNQDLDEEEQRNMVARINVNAKRRDMEGGELEHHSMEIVRFKEEPESSAKLNRRGLSRRKSHSRSRSAKRNSRRLSKSAGSRSLRSRSLRRSRSCKKQGEVYSTAYQIDRQNAKDVLKKQIISNFYKIESEKKPWSFENRIHLFKDTSAVDDTQSVNTNRVTHHHS